MRSPASGFALVAAVYFVGFWSTAGQTPGMRLLGLRVVSYAHAPLGVGRSAVRLFGLALSIALCFTGFLPALVDGRQARTPGLPRSARSSSTTSVRPAD